jgi:predicted ATPase
VERLGKLPILLAISFRPEFAAPWIGHPDVSVITMSRMNRQQSATLALQVTAEHGRLTAALLDRIITQADGVPLFIEELTKEVLESSEGYDGATPLLSVPGTLHALLMARLDRLSAGKQVAQVGAAIGREFQSRLVEAVADLPKAQLAQGLNQLVVSGLVLRRGSSSDSSYIFKHALVQDAAYGTLLRSRRQALHTRIAATLEGRFPEIVLAQPALLAQHCAEAGLAEKAVAYWLKAGQQAMDRSAMTEAFAQLRKGLDVLAGLPDGPSRQEQELDLQTALGWALTATKGYSAPEVEETLARARTLAQQLDRPEHSVPLIFGQFWFHNGRSEHRLALPLAGQLEQIGEMRNDAALLGHFTHGACRLSLGEFVAARAALQRCVGLAGPGHFTTELLSVDPYLAMLTWLALALACLGYIDQARSRMDEALSEARRLRHVHTLALMFCMASWLDWLTRSPMVHTEEVLTLTVFCKDFCEGVWRHNITSGRTTETY